MGCDVSCNGVPYFEINQNQSQVPVNIFLDNLERNFNPDSPYSHRVQNFQSFEMGMDETITDETQMRVELQRLIDRFDVIVLIERFWESLVLIALRNLFYQCGYDIGYSKSKFSQKHILISILSKSLFDQIMFRSYTIFII